ncbi:Uncharacterised protein [Vibrio cholerae]|nr:Uncharacterised protein [Vibrio cholerae]
MRAEYRQNALKSYQFGHRNSLPTNQSQCRVSVVGPPPKSRWSVISVSRTEWSRKCHAPAHRCPAKSVHCPLPSMRVEALHP